MKRRDHIQTAMRNHGIIIFVMVTLVLFGVWSLPKMNKNEFPQFTIRQAVVAAIYPGATAQEVEEQVTAPLEGLLFSYEEINKQKTYSVTEDGMVYIYAALSKSVKNKDQAWAKIRAGIDLFKLTSLPQGVLQVVVVDDFGNSSSVLLAMESNGHTPRELEQYSKQICAQLRTIPEMGKLKVMGQQSEEIAVEVDLDKLSRYAIDRTTLLAQLASQGFRTVGGTLGDSAGHASVCVSIPYRSEYELGEQVIYSNPADGSVVHLRDVATISRQYPTDAQRVDYFEAGTDKANCLIISMEMSQGHNIVEFGYKVDEALQRASTLIPPDVHLHRITDLPKVVDKSVRSFLHDILLSILVVIAVMLLLFPLRTALVAGIGVPVCSAIALGIMYLTGIELNTVTLAALIVVLGLIVDDAVIVVDGYTNLLAQGHSRWYSAAVSTRQLFVPMLVATFSICGMFFPMTGIFTDFMGEFVKLFPWTITFALAASLLYATWVAPWLATRLIKKPASDSDNILARMQNAMFTALQRFYDRVISVAFRVPTAVLLGALAAVLLGVFIFLHLNVQLMPMAERDCFAVEIHMREGASIRETAALCDSLADALTADPRVKSITSFVGQSSPRFHVTYSPQPAKPGYAQFIVNTISDDATEALIAEYTSRYENRYPQAYVRFKQMGYQGVNHQIEVFFSGDDYDQLAPLADSLRAYMSGRPEFRWAHSDYEQYVQQAELRLRDEEAARLGVSQTMLSLYLSQTFGGQKLTSVWEGDYKLPVTLYVSGVDTIDFTTLGDVPVPTGMPAVWVPLRQVADIVPTWHHATLGRRNSVRTVTVCADLPQGVSQPAAEKVIKRWVKTHLAELPDGVEMSYGGLSASNRDVMPELILSVLAALLVMFVVLLYHFGRVPLAVLTLSSALLCFFGACLGLYIFHLDFSMTAVLGLVSLIGIIVRNAIMMYEYAEELRHERHMSVREAAFEAGLRRMRPIFLTSATTALGVIPMILAHTSLWMPMGVVICFGTLFTLPLALTVLPVAYWKAFAHQDKRRATPPPSATQAEATLLQPNPSQI